MSLKFASAKGSLVSCYFHRSRLILEALLNKVVIVICIGSAPTCKSKKLFNVLVNIDTLTNLDALANFNALINLDASVNPDALVNLDGMAKPEALVNLDGIAKPDASVNPDDMVNFDALTIYNYL